MGKDRDQEHQLLLAPTGGRLPNQLTARVGDGPEVREGGRFSMCGGESWLVQTQLKTMSQGFNHPK